MRTATDTSVAEDLNRGVLPTEISRPLAWLMTGLFLAMIFALPVAQTLIELSREGRIRALDVFTRLPTRENLHQYEKDLDHQSVAKRWMQPRVQLALSQSLAYGNTNAVIGRDGWMFYRPGVELLTGRGLLDDARLRLRTRELREAGEKHPAADPRIAIRAFDEDCRRAGVHLVVLPVPDKAMLQPAELTTRLAFDEPTAPPTNRDYFRLLDELRAAGVDVFDPTPAKLVPGEAPRFLRQDTHWTPAWMGEVARGLSAHLRPRLPSTGSRSFAVRETEVSRVGDIVDMLELPADQSLYAPQSVTIANVLANGSPWQPNVAADVLLLGDSFSNVYNAPEMGWGESAGLPAQLARSLARDVDLIARNGSGASATRRELARRPDPLAGKKVIVWEFAARDLMSANWEVVHLSASEHQNPSREPERPAAPAVVVEATVLQGSRVPPPFSVPYKDCVTYVKFRVDRVVEGAYGEGQIIAVLWGLKDNVRQPAASYAAGKRLRLKLVPLRQAPAVLRGVRSVDDLEDYDHLPYFALEESGL